MKLTKTQQHTLAVLREMSAAGQAVHVERLADAMKRCPDRTTVTLVKLAEKGRVKRAGAHWLPVSPSKRRTSDVPSVRPVMLKPNPKVMTAAEVWSIARRQRPKVKAPRHGWSPQLGAFAEERK